MEASKSSGRKKTPAKARRTQSRQGKGRQAPPPESISEGPVEGSPDEPRGIKIICGQNAQGRDGTLVSTQGGLGHDAVEYWLRVALKDVRDAQELPLH